MKTINYKIVGYRQYISSILATVLVCAVANLMAETAEPTEKGLTVMGSAYFPAPRGSEEINFPNGNFENANNQWPTGGWAIPDGNQISRTVIALTEIEHRVPKPSEIAVAMGITLGEYDYIFQRIKEGQITSPWGNPAATFASIQLISGKAGAEAAPEGKAYLHIPAGKMSLLRSPDFEVYANQPHLLSLWVRSTAEVGGGPWFWYDLGLEEISVGFKGLPNTKGQWRRVGVYFRAPAGVARAHWTLYCDVRAGNYVDLDDVQLRTATEAEFSEAYQYWRKKMPVHEVSAAPEDGKYLATTIAKLEGRLGVPNKPFLIWGVGSSWTYFQGDLETWRQIIRERFPKAPPVIYKNRVGSGCPYDYARGWVHDEVLAEQPDLIFSYTGGSPEALEAMLKDIREHSTADIIIPSLHFFENSKMTEEEINDPENDKYRKICEHYRAQFVDNRRELAAWLKQNNRKSNDLLCDAVHQNELGVLLINENICRHFVNNSAPAYDPMALEKRLMAAEAFSTNDSAFTFSEGWEIKDNCLASAKTGASLKLNISGNSIDLVGWKTPQGGTMRVLIDGMPASQAPVFNVGYVKPDTGNMSHFGVFARNSRGNADTGPHGIWLGKDVVPQEWTIRMIDDQGNYEVNGRVTGPDGRGHNKHMFNSNSGQLIIDPAVWRSPESNIKEDHWTFEVTRCATETVSFKSASDQAETFAIPLVQNLPNTQHTLELIVDGAGNVAIDSLYIRQPLLK